MKSRKMLYVIASLLTACALLVGNVFFSVDAASSSEIREQINELEQQQTELEEQMKELEAQLSENLQDITATVKQKEQIDQQIFLLQKQLILADEQISACKVLIADKQDEMDEAQLLYSTLHDNYIDRIRAMEEQGDLSYWSVLFQANSFSELLDRVNMIQEIAASDNRRLRELHEASVAVSQLHQELLNEKTVLEYKRQQHLSTQQLLNENREKASQLLQKLIAEGDTYEKLLAESELLQEELMKEIAQKEVEFDKAAYQEWLATYVPPTTTAPPTTKPKPTQPPKPTDPSVPTDPYTPPNPDSVVWVTPVPYYILTSPFGMRYHPILGVERMHEGVDLACAEGTEIYATRGGVVTITSYQENGAGNYVQIDHGDGYKSIYMHMTHYIVSVGQYVAAGQVIGYVGSTGLSDGNHLHFGISYNGTYVNPMEYIS